MFLLSLQKLGKGDWCGIARNYVISRTPTQVASHAQKYFIRQTNVSRRKRRSSLFDIIADDQGYTPLVPQDFLSGDYLQEELQCDCLLPAENDNPLLTPALYKDSESMDSTKLNDGDLLTFKHETSLSYCPILYPAYVSPGFSFPLPFWSGNDNNTDAEPKEAHEVLKPTAIHSKSPINVDELVGMSKLSLGESIGQSGPSSLSLKLVEVSSRQSAFHVNPGSGSSSMNMSADGNPIHAV